MPVVVKKTCDQTIVEVYTCPAPDGLGGVPYIGVNVGGGVGVYKLTDQVVAPREHHFYTLVGINGTQVNRVGDQIQIEGGNYIEFATREETDLGVITDKALNPDVGAYAYDRFRYVGQHAAGKGTATVELFPVGTNTVIVNGALSNVFKLTLDRDVQFSDPINPVNGQTVNIHLKQNATGGYSASFSSAWKFTNKINPVLTADPNAHDMLSCQWDESEGVMCCSFLPDYGANYLPPPIYDDTDLVFVNVGGANEICKGRNGLQVSFRTLRVEGDLSASTVDDTVVISYTAPVQTIEVLNDLVDVNAPLPNIGDTLMWDGEYWIPQKARRFTLGATWTNGANALAVPVNEVSAVVSEKCKIVGWYLLTDSTSGSCQVDVRKIPVWEFPPLDTDTICGGNKPVITNAYMDSDFELTGWDVDCAEGELLQFDLESVASFKSVQIILVMEKVP